MWGGLKLETCWDHQTECKVRVSSLLQAYAWQHQGVARDVSVKMMEPQTRCILIWIIYIDYLHKNAYIHTYIHTYVRTYRQTDIHTYIQTYIHTDIHTYIHIHYLNIYILYEILFGKCSGWFGALLVLNLTHLTLPSEVLARSIAAGKCERGRQKVHHRRQDATCRDMSYP